MKVQVILESGIARQFQFKEQNYILIPKDESFSIRLTPDVEGEKAVVSVNGLNVRTGKHASFQDKPTVVNGPWDIAGWPDLKAFTADNAGCIGLAISRPLHSALQKLLEKALREQGVPSIDPLEPWMGRDLWRPVVQHAKDEAYVRTYWFGDLQQLKAWGLPEELLNSDVGPRYNNPFPAQKGYRPQSPKV